MSLRRRLFTWLVVLLGVTALAAGFTRGMGFTSRAAPPSAFEETTMRALRSWAIPAEMRRRTNPVEATPEAMRAGLMHWADHCATCHANDGSGDAPIGRSLYPPAPDMRGPRTQGMSDGELFYVIEQGVPFTGMPAWRTGTESGERQSWELVLFVRHLPRLTAAELEEMERFNPRSRLDEARERDIDDFLKGPPAAAGGGSE